MTTIQIPYEVAIALDKERCKRSYSYFCQQAWPILEPSITVKWGWALDAMCEHLQALHTGDIQNLLINCPPGMAKALEVSTPVPTLEGWKNHGDLVPGDFVYGTAGELIRVIAVTPHILENAYRIAFDDRSELIAGGAHEWLVEREYGWKRERTVKIVETLDLIGRGKSNGIRKDQIKIASAPAYKPPQNLLIDPYVLGAWLGDGDSNDGCLYASHEDVEHFRHLGITKKTKEASDLGQAFYRIRVENLRVKLRICNLLNNKHIPEVYELGSAEQRIALVQGLFDTDGHCEKGGLSVFSNKNRQICDALFRILSSLGLNPRMTERQSSFRGKDYGHYWRVSCRRNEAISLFRLKRKSDRQKIPTQNRYKNRGVVSVDLIGPRLISCIQVEGGMYLAGEKYTPTHNSMLTSVLLNAFIWGPGGKPYKDFLTCSYEEGLATRDSTRTRNLLKSEWFQERWPIQFSGVTDGKREFSNTETGTRTARSFFSLLGRRGDFLIADDPLNIKKANSEVELKNTEIEFTETFVNRINDPETSSSLVIMQRLHNRDPSGIIFENGLPYEKLILPMRYEADRKYYTSIGWTDPRTEDGELLFPERFPIEDVDRREKTMGTHAVPGQHQQRPVARGGGIFKERFFRYWHKDACPQIMWRVMYADTASKEEERNDYSVLLTAGMTRDGSVALLDMHRGKWEAPELDTNTRQFWAAQKAIQGKGILRELRVEDKSSGTGLIQSLRKPLMRDGVNYESIPIKAIQRDTDKVSRAHSCSPQIEQGFVLFPFDANWILDFKKEMIEFPAARHDDMVDTCMDAIHHMRLGPTPRSILVGSPTGSIGPKTFTD